MRNDDGCSIVNRTLSGRGRFSEEHAAITRWQHLTRPLSSSSSKRPRFDRQAWTKGVSTVGTEPTGICQYSVDINSLTYAVNPHT